MKYTLLELTQRILESMESDEVNSISDTTESQMVANIIKECYYDIVGELDLPEHETVFNLVASGDNEKPCVMTLPSNVIDLYNVKYNRGTAADPDWVPVQYVPFDKFMTLTNLDTDLDTVDIQELDINGTNFVFKFWTDRTPTIYTSPNDTTLIFDAYDSEDDTTLVSSKTMCAGLTAPAFTMADGFIPVLDARQFQLLLQAAKAQAFFEIKQVENPKAERKERRNRITAQRTKATVEGRTSYEEHLQQTGGYGRK